MKELRELSNQVLSIYEEMGETFSRFQKSIGLSCRTGCGECCLNPEVTASVLEMLPMAFDFLDRGIAESMLFDLETKNYPSCPLYKKLSSDGKKGMCSEYKTRPTLCRVFATGARIGKNGKELSVCKVIKEDHGEDYKKHPEYLNEAPLMSEWEKKVEVLSFYLGRDFFPIAEALKNALLLVLEYSFYISHDDVS